MLSVTAPNQLMAPAAAAEQMSGLAVKGALWLPMRHAHLTCRQLVHTLYFILEHNDGHDESRLDETGRA